ncbi:MAG: hypothetical protein AAFV45_13695 [Pseudomonadota bacterium]
MELQPFDPWPIVLVALFNPISAVVAFVMGRAADQWQKIIVAGFAAALAGYVGVWLATHFGMLPITGIGQATGVFMMQFVFGLIWAGIGYAFFHGGKHRSDTA